MNALIYFTFYSIKYQKYKMTDCSKWSFNCLNITYITFSFSKNYWHKQNKSSGSGSCYKEILCFEILNLNHICFLKEKKESAYLNFIIIGGFFTFLSTGGLFSLL